MAQTVKKKKSAYNARDLGLVPESERSSGKGNGNPLQYSCLEDSMDRRAWWASVHGVARVRYDWVTNAMMVLLVVMYGCESWTIKEGWAPKNGCLQTVVLEKTLESPFDSKKIKLGNPKENQAWIVIGRTDAEAEAPTLWPPDWKGWLTGKDPDAGKDWR